MYGSFNHQPSDSIKAAVTRLFRILNAEKFQLEELSKIWREAMLKKKLQKIMSPEHFEKFHISWGREPRNQKKSEVLDILNNFELAFGHEIFCQISEDLEVNNISTETMQTKKSKSRKIDEELQKIEHRFGVIKNELKKISTIFEDCIRNATEKTDTLANKYEDIVSNPAGNVRFNLPTTTWMFRLFPDMDYNGSYY